MSKQKLFLGAWIVSHFVYIVAWTFTPYPNQIVWISTALVFALGFSLFGEKAFGERSFVELLAFVALYYVAFAVVSRWEQFPGTTFTYLKFELVHIVTAANWYMLGRMIPWERTVQAHVPLGLGLMIFALVQMFLFPDSSRWLVARYGYGEELMLCLPAMWLLGRRYLAGLGLLVMLASLHKTPLAGAITAVSLMAILAWWKLPRLKTDEARRRLFGDPRYMYLRPVFLILALAVCIGAAMLLSTHIVNAVARFVPETTVVRFGDYEAEGAGEDIERTYITTQSLELLPKFWAQGMGYMNFSIWTGLDPRQRPATRFGTEEEGTSLHNSYMTWLLEGGLLVTSVILLSFFRTVARIRRLIKRAETIPLGFLMVAWTAALLILGGYHQLHTTVQLWGTIGFIFGVSSALPMQRRPRQFL